MVEGPVFTPAADSAGGRLLDIRFDVPEVLWPWSGYLGILIRVRSEGQGFQGEAAGEISFTVETPSPSGPLRSTVRAPLKASPGSASALFEPCGAPSAAAVFTVFAITALPCATAQCIPRRSTSVCLCPAPHTSPRVIGSAPLQARIIPTPPRSKRVLWDQYHSAKYPAAYIPKDTLEARSDTLDWHGDHPHTNFHELFNDLVRRGAAAAEVPGCFACPVLMHCSPVLSGCRPA